MSELEALPAAKAAGLELSLDGRDIIAEALSCGLTSSSSSRQPPLTFCCP